MLRKAVDLVLHMGGWVLTFGVAIELMEAHPQAMMLATGLAVTVVARRML